MSRNHDGIRISPVGSSDGQGDTLDDTKNPNRLASDPKVQVAKAKLMVGG